MANAALFIYGITNLKGGGGAERFFADFFDKYGAYASAKFKLFFILDKISLQALQEVNRLKQRKNCLLFRVYSNRFKTVLEFVQLLFFIITRRISVIHLPLYNISYLPLLNQINRLPNFIRPKVVINISNCYVVPRLLNKESSEENTYFPLFHHTRIDGYFSWYENFVSYAQTHASQFKHAPALYAITSRFADTSAFFPEKNKLNQVVFASRLDEQKRPDWLIEAIAIIAKERPALLSAWQFLLCGDGPLSESLKQKVKDLQLAPYIEFRIEGQLNAVLNHSRVYVSCQDFENFPSLSMAEAMAAGNAIIARNVGQTHLFLQNNENGLFINPDTPDGLANVLIQLLNEEDKINEMGQESVKRMQTKHTFENFVPQIENFWNSLILN
jgi:glycosyltransferase involved in cell wall biosynthesis